MDPSPAVDSACPHQHYRAFSRLYQFACRCRAYVPSTCQRCVWAVFMIGQHMPSVDRSALASSRGIEVAHRCSAVRS
eukprot:2983869-Prymnesium_polylepis.1